MQVDLLKCAAQLSEVEHAVRAINGEARIIRTKRSQVDLDRILERRAYQGAQTLTEGAPATEASCSDSQTACADHCHRSGAAPHADNHSGVHIAPDGQEHRHSADPQQLAHTHDTGIRTIAVREHRLLDLERCGWSSWMCRGLGAAALVH